MITLLSDISLALIIMLPIIIVRVLISNNKGIVNSSGLAKFCSVIIILNFLLIKTSIDFGDFASSLFWQFLIIYPISFGAIYYLLKFGKSEVSPKSLLMAFKRRQQYALGLIIMLSFSIVIIGINKSNQQVLDTHNQLIIELLESDNAMETLVYKTITPNSVLEILPYLQEIKEGEIEVLSLPWKSNVKVTTNRNKEQYTREFTYVRFNKEWKLDGIYRSSVYYPSN